MNQNVYTEPISTNLEILRLKRRSSRKITYDCFNAHTKGENVHCIKGHIISPRPEGMSLLVCLKGGSTTQCLNCPDYDN
jgi:hypothetical protein